MTITSVLKKFFHAHIDGQLAGYIRDSDGAIKLDVVVSEIVDVDIDTLPAVGTVEVFNVILAIVDTEYEQVLPDNTKEFRFRCRTIFDVRYAFVTGIVAIPTAPYLTLPAGMEYSSDGNDLDGQSIFFATDEAGVVVELEIWTP